jgi:hypothetical protein
MVSGWEANVSECGSAGGGLSHTADQLKGSLDTAPRLCPVCQVVGVHLRRHFDTLFYELVNDGPTRERIRRAGGFCRYHADLIAAQGDALGAALIFQDVLDNELRGLEAGDFNRPPQSAGTIARLFEGRSSDFPVRSPCPLCDAERQMDERAIDNLL